MATKLSIYNGALKVLGESPLNSLAEERPARNWLDRSWDDGIVDYCLEQGQWHWATRTQRITASTTIIPAYGPKYAFEVPIDYKGMVSMWANPSFTVPLENYIIEANVIYSDWDTIYIKFVSNAATYGNNLARWPEVFAKYAEGRLASDVQPNITNSDSMFKKTAMNEASTLATAKNSDKRDKPIQRLPLSNWARARLGGFDNRYDSNYNN